MKSPITIATVIGLIMLTLIEGHIVWIQNKALSGTSTCAAATLINEGKHFSFEGRSDNIDAHCETAHTGYSLNITDDKRSYWLVFGVSWSTEENKWRGPYTNDGDKCWHFHGSEDSWDVYPCPQ